MKKLSLYFHFPFCLKKCRYCDFNSRSDLQNLWEPYLEALSLELESYGDLIAQREVATLYWGGGTPSLIPLPSFRKLFSQLKRLGVRIDRAETTIEVNPGTVTPEKAKAWKDLGVNRVSLGVQTFNSRLLKTLGRIYLPDEIYQAWGYLADFDTLSLDLIYGIPGETADTWRSDLEQGLELAPAHLSLYELTLEPGTSFHKNRNQYKFATDRELLDFSRTAESYLEKNGYHHYEISNYALPGKRSQHNLNYWNRGEYLGIGAGAHSFIKETRWANVKAPAEYMKAGAKGRPIGFRERIDSPTARGEFLMLGLRKLAGVSLEAFREFFGISLFSAYPETVPRLIKAGLLEVTGETLLLTARGRIYADEVFSGFMAL